MGWVVLGHTYQSMLFDVDNKIYAGLTVQPRLASQIITGGQLGVDTFFFLSGFLATYVGLKKMRGKNPPVAKSVLAYYLDRYLRLTPAYFTVLMIYMYLRPKLSVAPDSWGSSKFVYVGKDEAHHHDHPDGGDYEDICTKYVWTNLLYISNLYPFSGEHGQFGQYADGNLGCMDHSWYLSVDFQLQLMVPWLLLLYKRSTKAAYGLMTSMIFASLAYVYWLALHYDGGLCGYLFQTANGNEMTLYYDKPWCRCGPFLIGVIFAGWIHEKSLPVAPGNPKGHLPKLPPMLALLGYVICATCMFTIIFATYWAFDDDPMVRVCQWDPWFDQLYSATRTTVWGCCIAFMVYVSLSCQGSILTGFLSLKFWTPIMSLTYGWYLLHPLWIEENYDAQARQLTYTDFLGTDMYVVNCIAGLAFSAVLFFTVEAPAASLKILLLPPPPRAAVGETNVEARSPNAGAE
eukprot:SAG31_NODE_3872_length_3796_cov_4.556127_2_plen_460_part_00